VAPHEKPAPKAILFGDTGETVDERIIGR